jgi:hypothetical protein
MLVRTSALALVTLTLDCSSHRSHGTAPGSPSIQHAASSPDAGLTSDRKAVRARCRAHATREACSQDSACVSFTQFGPNGMGGPEVCGACIDWSELEGVPPEYCNLRARGQDRAACELRFRNDPARCSSLTNDP